MTREEGLEIVALLDKLEVELRRLSLWQEVPPDTWRLQSEMPFCIDTLEFTEWLQWLFLPKMRLIIEQDLPLPLGCSIAPAASLGLSSDASALLPIIKALDEALALRS